MLRDRREHLVRRYGADLSVVGVAELGGAAIDQDGIDLRLLIEALAAGVPLGEVAGVGRAGWSALELLRACDADVLLGATPVNLADGQPGLGLVRAALAAGTHVVLADKGPVALAYDELAAGSDLADGWGRGSGSRPEALPGREGRPCLRFSATVAGALPVINIGVRDFAGEQITRIEGVFNGTSQYILRSLEAGSDFAEALADTQRRGIAEADPSLDIDGHDAAFKLLITANAVLGAGAQLEKRRGHRDQGDLARTSTSGERVWTPDSAAGGRRAVFRRVPAAGRAGAGPGRSPAGPAASGRDGGRILR